MTTSPGSLIGPRVFGIGLGRTGTKSLAVALSFLEVEPCIHNPPFSQIHSIRAGTDNGVTAFYRYLDYKYPGSKFILTVRGLPSWLRSMESITGYQPVDRGDDDMILRRTLIYGTTIFDRRAYIQEFKRHHRAVLEYFRGRREDLLVMDILNGDGWEVLCPFLELPIPDIPFPHRNARPRRKPFQGWLDEQLFRWGLKGKNSYSLET